MQIRILVLLAMALFVACDSSSNATINAMNPPPAPQLPQDFQWEGRWIVSDLNIDVPFTWQGKEGNSQMIAGGDEYEIHFTNLIYNDRLYTLTYKWPGIEPPADDPGKLPHCSCLGEFTLDVLNTCLENLRYVGAETLQEIREG